MTRRALLIAYHFPPVQGSSGILRTLSFARHLPEFGWEPLILTAHPRAYPRTSDHQLADIPEDLVVTRAFALDTARHLAIRGTYPGPLAVPDRWWTWWLGAVPAGLRMIRRYRPEVIWSTAPIVTAHWIAATLNRLSGLPWIADIRDLLTEPDEPADPLAWKATRRIETRALKASTRTVVVSPGQRTEYLRQFPDLDPDRITVIPNGYDEAAFAAIEREAESPATSQAGRGTVLHLVHSGVLYPQSRNPRPFFEALAELIEEGVIAAERIRITLRASGSEDQFAAQAQQSGLAEQVELPPPLPYRQALAEILEADGLLLFQGEDCNTAIPAKLYEYIRARRPLFALTDPEGATGETIQRIGSPYLAPLESAEAIKPVLKRFLSDIQTGNIFLPTPEAVEQFSRRRGSQALAELFDDTTRPGFVAPRKAGHGS